MEGRVGLRESILCRPDSAKTERQANEDHGEEPNFAIHDVSISGMNILGPCFGGRQRGVASAV
jgi:hypothetical protein